jgi:hypothetical protein
VDRGDKEDKEDNEPLPAADSAKVHSPPGELTIHGRSEP